MVVTPNEVIGDLETNVLPELLARYPGIQWSLAGEQEEQARAFEGLFEALGLALIVIYALLAIPFRSYLQPMIVMSAIPFGLIGAVVGHRLVGINLTMLSLLGLIALTGVVVNDSLVMVDFINRRIRAGMGVHEAIRDAGAARFRPIVLTSLTTFRRSAAPAAGAELPGPVPDPDGGLARLRRPVRNRDHAVARAVALRDPERLPVPGCRAWSQGSSTARPAGRPGPCSRRSRSRESMNCVIAGQGVMVVSRRSPWISSASGHDRHRPGTSA